MSHKNHKNCYKRIIIKSLFQNSSSKFTWNSLLALGKIWQNVENFDHLMHYKMRYYHFSWLLHLSNTFHFSSNFTCSFSSSVPFLPMFLSLDIPQSVCEEFRSIHVCTMEDLVNLLTSLCTIWSCSLILNQQTSQLAVENFFAAVSQVSSKALPENFEPSVSSLWEKRWD